MKLEYAFSQSQQTIQHLQKQVLDSSKQIRALENRPPGKELRPDRLAIVIGVFLLLMLLIFKIAF
jgi:hypothetical protein